MTTVKVRLERFDGKTIIIEWDPTRETWRDALKRCGVPGLARLVEDPCPKCGSIRRYEDGTCASCIGAWPQ